MIFYKISSPIFTLLGETSIIFYDFKMDTNSIFVFVSKDAYSLNPVKFVIALCSNLLNFQGE